MIQRFFHPIGQGAFYSERHTSCNINIVYDCGTTNPSSQAKQRVVNQSFSKDEIVSHGFRAMFSTVCNENTHIHGYSEAIIEKCLAHKDANSVRAAYNRAANLSHMKGLMQWWADYLDNL